MPNNCQFRKADGSLCKRGIDEHERFCWQHARGLVRKWRSLTRNQSIMFVVSVLALAVGLPSAYWSYMGSGALVELITGGNGYCWVVPVDPLPVGLGGDPAHQGSNYQQLGLKNSGNVILPTCDIRFMPFPTDKELREGVSGTPSMLTYHFEKVPVMRRGEYRYTSYFITGDRIYSGVIETPTHSFIEVIKFEPDPSNRKRFIPKCLVTAPSEKTLENDCYPQ